MITHKKATTLFDTKGRVTGWRIPCYRCGESVHFTKADTSRLPNTAISRPDDTATCVSCWKAGAERYRAEQEARS